VSSFHTRLQEFRKAAGLSQGDAAKALGINRSYLSLVESGKRGVSSKMLRKFSQAYDIPYSSLLMARVSDLLATSGEYKIDIGKLSAPYRKEVLDFIQYQFWKQTLSDRKKEEE